MQTAEMNDMGSAVPFSAKSLPDIKQRSALTFC
jgi:hypothetical protein